MKWFKRTARPEAVDTPDAVSPEMLELRGVVDMIDRTQARIMFTPDGTILWANDNFLEVMKYDLSEIVGKHHSLFLSEAERSMPGYREFWAQLAGGAFFQDQFARIAKDGSTVWIRATYAPVFDAQGKVVRVMKIANDITGRQSEIETLAACLARMEDGILAQQVPVAASDDLARLGTALGSALARLTGAINAVKTAVEQVTTTAGRIRVSSSDLAQRTEYQAATLEAAAGAVQEITSTLTATAGQARDVRQVAAEAQTTAEESGKVVRDAVEAMQRIETSSNRISQIISVIDEIASRPTCWR
ncbi:MAG: PAS domain-containing protein [Paracoccaceae bacterium]